VAVVWFTGWADKWAGAAEPFFSSSSFFVLFVSFTSFAEAQPRQCIRKVPLVNAYGKYHVVSLYYF
jgi:hypothetical protein